MDKEQIKMALDTKKRLEELVMSMDRVCLLQPVQLIILAAMIYLNNIYNTHKDKEGIEECFKENLKILGRAVFDSEEPTWLIDYGFEEDEEDEDEEVEDGGLLAGGT